MILTTKCTVTAACVGLLCLIAGHPAFALFNLGAGEVVQAGGEDLVVDGNSVPSYVDWNNDGLADLVIGDGGCEANIGRVRIYLNHGSLEVPEFTDFFYAQSEGQDLTEIAVGCMGLFPRVVYWDDDDNKDLLMGTSHGNVKIYLNVGSDTEPSFDGGVRLQLGQPPFTMDIDVGDRATPTIVDWNNDGKRDLVSGSYEGLIYVFINEGTDTAPVYLEETYAQADGADLIVESNRSSPVIGDFDNDGRKDLLAGNTEGQLLFYPNTWTDAAPAFSGYKEVEADGIPILLESGRSRPFVCDWTLDGLPDVVIGAIDAKIYLFQGRQMVFSAGLVCTPTSGTLPFMTQISVSVTNQIDYGRVFAGRLDWELASGKIIDNFRSGIVLVPPQGTVTRSLNYLVPHNDNLVGENVGTLTMEDITPPPYNQPPRPPSGTTDTDNCSLQGIAVARQN